MTIRSFFQSFGFRIRAVRFWYDHIAADPSQVSKDRGKAFVFREDRANLYEFWKWFVFSVTFSAGSTLPNRFSVTDIYGTECEAPSLEEALAGLYDKYLEENAPYVLLRDALAYKPSTKSYESSMGRYLLDWIRGVDENPGGRHFYVVRERTTGRWFMRRYPEPPGTPMYSPSFINWMAALTLEIHRETKQREVAQNL